MANPHKGDVAFESGGKTYILRFSIDALCALEDAAGKGVVALSSELSDPDRIRIGLLRQVVWAGLREHHPDIDVKAAGELIADAGGLAKMVECVALAFDRAFPSDGKPNGAARPRGPGQDGTGPASSRDGAA